MLSACVREGGGAAFRNLPTSKRIDVLATAIGLGPAQADAADMQ